MSNTIYLIHGLWGGSWYWEYYIGFFESRGYKCYAPTLRYHDPKLPDIGDRNLGTTSLLEYANDLENELRGLDTIPILMGYSMGGLLAQILASRVPAEALVLINSAAPAGIFAITPSVIRSFWSIFTTWGFWKKPIVQKYEEAAYSTLNLLPPQEQQIVFEKFVYDSGKATTEMGLWIFDPRKASKVDESKIDCPVLVIGCTEDRITPVSIIRQIAKKYGNKATYREFANHAHYVIAEPGWEEVAEFIYSWLQDQSPVD